MSYSQWSSFAYYNTGDIVSYLTINYSALQANVNVVPTTLGANWVVLAPPVGGGVTSLVAGTGNLTMSLVNGGTVGLVGNDIQITVPPPTIPTSVTSLTVGTTALTGNVFLAATDSSIGVALDGQQIQLTSPLSVQLSVPSGSLTNTTISSNPLAPTTIFSGSINYTNLQAGNYNLIFYLNFTATMLTTAGNDLLSVGVNYPTLGVPPQSYNGFYIQTTNKATGCNAVSVSYPVSFLAGGGSIDYELLATSANGDNYTIAFNTTYLFLSPVQ